MASPSLAHSVWKRVGKVLTLSLVSLERAFLNPALKIYKTIKDHGQAASIPYRNVSDSSPEGPKGSICYCPITTPSIGYLRKLKTI